MIIDDKIYGRFKITEPVLIELIRCPSVQRLKGVSTRGYPPGVPGRPGHSTRYDHSVGCMLLLRKLGASLEEQVAGLLHDVSHTAFSHVMDWVMKRATEADYQDSILKDYIQKSEIPEILRRHGFNGRKIGEMEEAEHFGLQERPAPQLCADRLDYTLRDLRLRLNINVKPLINDLSTFNGHIVFKSYGMALRFAKYYASYESKLLASSDDIVRYHLMSLMIKRTVDENIIAHKDLYRPEAYILDKIRAEGSAGLKRQLRDALGILKYKMSKNGIHLGTKFRRVDPEFIEGGRMLTVMGRNTRYREQIRRQGIRERAGIRVKLLYGKT